MAALLEDVNYVMARFPSIRSTILLRYLSQYLMCRPPSLLSLIKKPKDTPPSQGQDGEDDGERRATLYRSFFNSHRFSSNFSLIRFLRMISGVGHSKAVNVCAIYPSVVDLYSHFVDASVPLNQRKLLLAVKKIISKFLIL